MAYDLALIAVVMVVVDYIYLQGISSHFRWQVQSVQGTPMKIRMSGALLCYFLLVVGLYYFIVRPNRDYYSAFLLGLVIYGVFETTNYALFSDWAASTVLIDTLWGGILFVITTYVVRMFSA